MRAADWKVQQGKATQAVSDAVRSFPVAGRRLRDELVRFVGTVGLVGLGFLGLFILHQATLWAAVRPAVAFERAKVVVYTAELVWDGTARVGNAGLQMVDAVIPLWNAGSHYVVEPAIYVLLDVMALIFTQEPYPGLIKESDVPYAGFTCSPDASTVSPAWCGRFEYYETRLRDADASGFQSGSIVLGTATARRLQAATGESLIPVIDVSTVVPGLSGLTSSMVTLVGSVADVVLYVVYTVLSEVAVLLWDTVFIMAKYLGYVLLVIVRSGMLETIINFAVDLIVILVLEIALPMLLATIDLLMCAIDLFFPSGWDTQLQCAAASARTLPATPCKLVALDPAASLAGASTSTASRPTRTPWPTSSSSRRCRSCGSASRPCSRQPSTATRASSTDSASCPTWTGSTRRPRPCPRPCAPSASCARRAACDSPDPSTREHTRARAPGGDARLCTPPSRRCPRCG